MHENLDRALTLVLKHEGGYVDHPKDPGGATNKGVTIATFKRYVNPAGTVDDLKKLTDTQARTVFERQYWDAIRGNQLPSGLDYAVFDFAVNSGPKRAAQFLQKIVGVEPDGVIGPETLKAVAAYGDTRLAITNLCVMRLDWLEGLKTWTTFGKGWEKRVNDVVKVAQEMALAPPAAPLPPPAPAPAPIPAEPPVYFPDEPVRKPGMSALDWVIIAGGGALLVIAYLFWPR